MVKALIGGLVKQLWSIFLILFLISLAVAIFKHFLPKLKGWIGEVCINFRIKRCLNQSQSSLMTTPDTARAPLMWGNAGNEQAMAKFTACQLHVFYDQM